MGRHPTITDDEVRAMHTWYKSQHGRTYQKTATHFGVSIHVVSRGFYRLGLEGTGTDPDPYSTAVHDAKRALQRGLDQGGSMNETEYKHLAYVLGILVHA